MSRVVKSLMPKLTSTKTFICCLLIGILFTSGLFVSCPFTSTNAPHLEVSVDYLDLGKGSPNEVVRGAFQLRNTGMAQLEFDINRSCACTELNPDKGTIAPGEVQEINLGIKLYGYANSERSVVLAINSNDPEQPVIHCRAVAKCPALLEVNPSFVSFGKIYGKEFSSEQRQVLVKSVEREEGLTRDSLQVGQEGDFFYIKEKNESNGKVLLRLFLRQGLGSGEYYGLLKLQMDGAKYGLTVPVSAHVVAPVSVIPSTIFVSNDWQWYESHPISVLFRSSKKDLLLSELRLDNPPPGITVGKVTELQPGLKRMQLKVSHEALTQPKTILNFTCDGIEKELTLTLLSSVQQDKPSQD